MEECKFMINLLLMKLRNNDKHILESENIICAVIDNMN